MFTHTTQFGIEIEFTHRSADRYTASNINHPVRTAITQALNEAGITCQNIGYTHRVTRAWKLIYDGSCGFELVSPILYGFDGLEQLKKVLSVLNQQGAKTNRKCGIHVHFDAGNLSFGQIKSACQRFIDNEDLFDAMQPESRRRNNNYFCQGHGRINVMRCRNISGLINKVSRSRYKKLNLQSYPRYGTIEVRHHAGSLNYKKLSSWIQLMAIVIYGTNSITRTDSVRERFEQLFDGANVTGSSQRTVMPAPDLKLKDIKEMFYSQAELENTRQIQKWAKDNGHELNLRTKADWLRLFQLYFNFQQQPQNNIKEFFRNRINSFGVIAV